MNATAPALQLQQASELAAAMEQINAARSFKEFAVADERARELGLRLRRGFYIQRRKIGQGTIDLVASVQNELELKEILQDIHYDELMR